MYKQFKRGTAMPRLKLEVLRKPCSTDMEQAVPRYSVRTTMQILVLRLKFFRFLTYKISITLLKI